MKDNEFSTIVDLDKATPDTTIHPIKQIIEHRHCNRCGRVLYLIKDKGTGHFLSFCEKCQELGGDYQEIWIPANL